MDWLRIAAFALLILYHIAMAFSPWDWVIKTNYAFGWLIPPMALLTPWRLPTEKEWEKAARGTKGIRFPWGDAFDPARANSADQGPFDTTPVSRHPGGASPFGVMDAAGQVFEWTATLAGSGDAAAIGCGCNFRFKSNRSRSVTAPSASTSPSAAVASELLRDASTPILRFRSVAATVHSTGTIVPDRGSKAMRSTVSLKTVWRAKVFTGIAHRAKTLPTACSRLFPGSLPSPASQARSCVRPGSTLA
ncbi:MAG: SUMF1/EgtB/PvdO family nonheme iron enzyme [Proteobacteria bacterium]|nr:SUMF1/EgtB/PvdO family nonheme iron enzyme [Pseudomonadota bacterium]